MTEYVTLQCRLYNILKSKGFSKKAIPGIMDNIERPFYIGPGHECNHDLDAMAAYYDVLKDCSKATINKLYGLKLHPGYKREERLRSNNAR